MDAIPIFEAIVGDEGTGVDKVSFVDTPAIMIDFVALRKQGATPVVVRQDKQIVYGPLLVPNQQIIRQNTKGTDTYSDDMPDKYYIRYSANTIERARDRFAEGEKFSTALNLMHGKESVPGVIVEQWIVDGENDKSKSLGFDLPEGTWMAGVRIKDESFWKKKIKSEELKGFSIEGKFKFVPVEQKQQKSDKTKNVIKHEWTEESEKTMQKLIKMMESVVKQNEVKKDDDKKEQVAQAEVVIEKDGVSYRALVAEDGTTVLFDPKSGKTMAAPDGEHKTNTGETIVIKDGKIEMEKKEEQSAPEGAPAPAQSGQTDAPSASGQQGATGNAVHKIDSDKDGNLTPPEGHQFVTTENGGVRIVPVQQLQQDYNGEVANAMVNLSSQFQQQQQINKQLVSAIQTLQADNKELRETLQRTSLTGFVDTTDRSKQQSADKSGNGAPASFLEEYNKQPDIFSTARGSIK